VDFAPKTVERTKESFPHLKISYGDVRHLEFPDRFFDGNWSLGVIEHFYEGYRPILEEMGRVLKPGGYLFLTFPCLSLLRRLKARLGLYPEALGTSSEKEHFYQFALDPAGVTKDLREVGFRVVRTQKLDGVKGLKDEVPVLKGFLQKLYDSSNPLIRLARGGLSLALAPFSNHSILIILKRND
jgi:SAM-dependent methyltransferase